MDLYGSVNPLIAGRLIGDTREQIFQAWPSGKAFFLPDLRVNRFLRKQGLQLLHERIGSQEHPSPQFTPHIDLFPLVHRSAICTYCTHTIWIELQEDTIDR